MKPLLDEDTEGSGNECNEQTQDPECVDSGGNSRSVERRNIEYRNSRVDEVPVDSQVGRLINELNEKNVGEIFGLLLKILVRLDDECRDHSGE